ncbi:MAG: hypothetical protein M1840_004125 [Geoglossum simile]|nr:MAG: hypothetical protein M1840_004125 [Geoglossum simile]
MGHSQDKPSSRTATHGRSKKRRRKNTDSNLPFGEAQVITPQKRVENAKKQKGHKLHPAREPTTSVAISSEGIPKPLNNELKAPIAEGLKQNKAVASDDRRDPGDSEKNERPKRFIVFIGNLPFTATTASISRHFASLKPASIRHITHKDQPTKSKGYAFLEFAGYDRMKTCLKLHHQSTFDDGLSASRKINVELTAGGGGAKSNERRAKLKEKNQKLNEERMRRSQEEKAKQEKDKHSIAAEVSDANGVHDVHPSRRGRVPGA